MNIEIIKQRILEQHGNIVTIVESSYEGFKKKARFIDVDYGEWKAFVYSICRGGRHKQRFLDEKRISYEEAQNRIIQAHSGTISIKKETWRSAYSPCTFIDIDFGEWTSILCNVVNGKGHPQRVKNHRIDSQRLSSDEIQKILDEKHCGKVNLVGPYINAGTKCCFKDVDFGEFEASPTNVFYKGTGHPKRALFRRKETSITKYGTNHPMQSDVVFLKHLHAQRKHIKIPHWKTGVVLNCANNWEFAFVQWCNFRREDFLWQPKAFKMPNGQTYRPDAYMLERNLWIDIKGYYPESSRVKCEWFKSIMPNFELWFKNELIELGILT